MEPMKVTVCGQASEIQNDSTADGILKKACAIPESSYAQSSYSPGVDSDASSQDCAAPESDYSDAEDFQIEYSPTNIVRPSEAGPLLGSKSVSGIIFLIYCKKVFR